MTGSLFQDHFSDRASSYAAARPDYPAALFDWLASIAPGRSLAWDAGTGNGQAAVALAGHFDRVIATDPSAEQIANAFHHSNVEYCVARAEDGIGAASASVDLVSAAQALHWFDRPAFYQRVREVLKPGGVIAAWCYGPCTVEPAIDAIMEHFYAHVVGPFWPPDRKWVDQQYRTIDFPFAEVEPPSFEMRHEWTLPQLVAYVRTWSAVKRYGAVRGSDPVDSLVNRLETVWGGPKVTRSVHWPLYLRAGRA